VLRVNVLPAPYVAFPYRDGAWQAPVPCFEMTGPSGAHRVVSGCMDADPGEILDARTGGTVFRYSVPRMPTRCDWLEALLLKHCCQGWDSVGERTRGTLRTRDGYHISTLSGYRSRAPNSRNTNTSKSPEICTAFSEACAGVEEPLDPLPWARACSSSTVLDQAKEKAPSKRRNANGRGLRPMRTLSVSAPFVNPLAESRVSGS
jgi:hypothetical protein